MKLLRRPLPGMGPSLVMQSLSSVEALEASLDGDGWGDCMRTIRDFLSSWETLPRRMYGQVVPRPV